MLLPDELLTHVFQSVSFASIQYMHTVRATCCIGRDAVEDVFLLFCSPSRFASGIQVALLDLTSCDRNKMQRTASQQRAYEVQVAKLKGIATARFHTPTQHLIDFVRHHLFILRNMHPDIKLLAQHVLFRPLWDEVHLQRREWKSQLKINLKNPAHALLSTPPPVLPHTVLIIWEREVGFVNMR